MSVRVIILRNVSSDQKGKIQPLLQQLHQKALQSGGYISGETLVNSEDNTNKLVISTWNTVADWERFVSREECISLHEQVDQILGVETVYQVYNTL